jgi:hypothetical protein
MLTYREITKNSGKVSEFFNKISSSGVISENSGKIGEASS